MFQKQSDQYPLDSAIEIAKARGKQMIYHSAAALGMWEYMIARRSGVPTDDDHQQYRDAWQTVSGVVAGYELNRLTIPADIANPNKTSQFNDYCCSSSNHLLTLAQPLTAFAPWPYFEADEIEAAAAVLRSGKVNYWTGQEGRRIRNRVCRSLGANMPYASPMGQSP